MQRVFFRGPLMLVLPLLYWFLAFAAYVAPVCIASNVDFVQRTLFIQGDPVPGIPGSTTEFPSFFQSSSDARVTISGTYTTPAGSGNAVWAYESSGPRLVAKKDGSGLYDDIWLQGSGAINSSGAVLLSTNGPQGGAVVLNHNGVEQVIAQTGEQATGFPPGVLYDIDQTILSILDSGTIAFRESISGPGISVGARLVYWIGRPNELKAAWRSGSPVPELPDYTSGALGRSLSYNSAGMFVIHDDVKHTLTGQIRHAIWAGTPGDVHLMAFEGMKAPGTTLEFAEFTNARVRINDFGKVSFVTNLNLPGTKTRAGSGFWYGSPENPQLIFGPENDTPFGPGTRWRRIDYFSHYESSNELAVFEGNYSDTLGIGHTGIFKSDLNNPSDVHLIAELNQPVHGIPNAGTYSSLTPEAINKFGDVLFTATITGTSSIPAGRGIWFVPAGGQPQIVALTRQKIDLDDSPAVNLREMSSFQLDASGFESRSFLFRASLDDRKGVLIQYVAVPEPETAAIAVLLLSGLGRFRWRTTGFISASDERPTITSNPKEFPLAACHSLRQCFRRTTIKLTSATVHTSLLPSSRSPLPPCYNPLGGPLCRLIFRPN